MEIKWEFLKKKVLGSTSGFNCLTLEHQNICQKNDKKKKTIVRKMSVT